MESSAENTATDRAREALNELGHGGDLVGVLDDGPGLFGVQFECALPGYRGWRWTVSVSEFEGAATINDIVLLPGADSIVAPAWTPYKDRVQADDLGPGDVLPPDADDLRLVPAWSAGDGEGTGVVDRHFAREIGLGRAWVLSLEGREDAADRWYDGDHGPESPTAKQASGACSSCGFLVSLAGDLADRFGVCANRMSKSDGRVVALNHGCGAHSGSRPKRSAGTPILPSPVYDTLSIDTLDIDSSSIDVAEIDPDPEPVLDVAGEPVVDPVESEAMSTSIEPAEADRAETEQVQAEAAQESVVEAAQESSEASAGETTVAPVADASDD